MWKFDSYGNAKNDETGEEFCSILCPDGVIRVYHNDKVINSFRRLDDAVNFIAASVKKAEGEENENN